MVNSLHGPILKQTYHKALSDLLDGLTANARLFADDVSLFSVVDNIYLSATNVNSDLSKINIWVSQWKMTFNTDHNKQAKFFPIK